MPLSQAIAGRGNHFLYIGTDLVTASVPANQRPEQTTLGLLSRFVKSNQITG
jgi:hypothetical protein